MSAASRAAAVPRREWLAALVLVAGALFLYEISVQDVFAAFNWDDAWYLLLADRTFGRLSDVPRLAAALDARGYPPLYPVWLGLFGGGSQAIARAFVANLVAVAGSALAYYVLARRSSIARGPALALLALYFVSPGTLSFGTELWSENLYTAWQFIAVAALAGPARSREQWLLAAIACALAALTRSAGVAWVAGFLALLAFERPKSGALFALVALAPPVAERLLHAEHVYESAGASNLLAALVRPEWWRTFAVASWQGWRDVTSAAPALGTLVGAALLAVVLVRVPMRLRERRLDAFALPAYLALLFGWGFSEHAMRFSYPVIPFAWLYAVELASRAPLREPLRARAAGATAAALIAACGAPGLIETLVRLAVPAPPDVAEFRHSSLWFKIEPREQMVTAARMRKGIIADARAIAARVAPGECVTSEFPPAVMAFAHRWSEAAPWRRLDEAVARAAEAPCGYYYVVPIMLAPSSVSGESLRSAYDIVYVSPVVPVVGGQPSGFLLHRRMNAP